jgi:hypothetical protein
MTMQVVFITLGICLGLSVCVFGMHSSAPNIGLEEPPFPAITLGALQSTGDVFLTINTALPTLKNTRTVLVLGTWDNALVLGRSGCSCATTSPYHGQVPFGAAYRLRVRGDDPGTYVTGSLSSLTDAEHSLFFPPGTTHTVAQLRTLWNTHGDADVRLSLAWQQNHTTQFLGGELHPFVRDQPLGAIKFDFVEHPCRPSGTLPLPLLEARDVEHFRLLDSVYLHPAPAPWSTAGSVVHRTASATWLVRINLQVALSVCGAARGVVRHPAEVQTVSGKATLTRTWDLRVASGTLALQTTHRFVTQSHRVVEYLHNRGSPPLEASFVSLGYGQCPLSSLYFAYTIHTHHHVVNTTSPSSTILTGKIAFAYSLEFRNINLHSVVGPRLRRVARTDAAGHAIAGKWISEDITIPSNSKECYGTHVVEILPDVRRGEDGESLSTVLDGVPHFCVGVDADGRGVSLDSPFALSRTCRFVVHLETTTAPLHKGGGTFSHMCPGRPLSSVPDDQVLEEATAANLRAFTAENIQAISHDALVAVANNTGREAPSAWARPNADPNAARMRAQTGRLLYGLRDFSLEVTPHTCGQGTFPLAAPHVLPGNNVCAGASACRHTFSASGGCHHRHLLSITACIETTQSSLSSSITPMSAIALSGVNVALPLGADRSDVHTTAGGLLTHICGAHHAHAFAVARPGGGYVDAHKFLCSDVPWFAAEPATGGAAQPRTSLAHFDAVVALPTVPHPTDVSFWIFHKNPAHWFGMGLDGGRAVDTRALFLQMDSTVLSFGAVRATSQEFPFRVTFARGVRIPTSNCRAVGDPPYVPSNEPWCFYANITVRYADRGQQEESFALTTPPIGTTSRSVLWSDVLDTLTHVPREMRRGERALGNMSYRQYPPGTPPTHTQASSWQERPPLPGLRVGQVSGVDGMAVSTRALVKLYQRAHDQRFEGRHLRGRPPRTVAPSNRRLWLFQGAARFVQPTSHTRHSPSAGIHLDPPDVFCDLCTIVYAAAVLDAQPSETHRTSPPTSSHSLPKFTPSDIHIRGSYFWERMWALLVSAGFLVICFCVLGAATPLYLLVTTTQKSYYSNHDSLTDESSDTVDFPRYRPSTASVHGPRMRQGRVLP